MRAAVLTALCVVAVAVEAAPLPRVRVAPDQRGFVAGDSGQAFHPWGMNYGNRGRLLEDFWESEWQTVVDDLGELKAAGANVVRLHLQVGRFMDSEEVPNAAALARLRRVLAVAEEKGIYIDLTGLATYRGADTPAWYDALEEPARWTAQARFWDAVAETCAASTAVFCYDLVNEPISPGAKREAGAWRSGSDFGGYDFLQYIALDPGGRKREEIPVEWIRRMTKAIRAHDRAALITVGLLPWSRQWKHLGGFVPEKVAPELDFISVHLYPNSKKPGEAMEALQQCAVGKPVVIEETFPLECSVDELEQFLRASKEVACGWIGHYDGQTQQELDALDQAGTLSGPQAVYRAWLQLFSRLKPELAPEPAR